VKAFPRDPERLSSDLLRFRAVLLLLAAPRGSKVATARSLVIDLESKHLRASIRSLYHWRSRYLLSGVAGLDRQRRTDAGRPSPRTEPWLLRIAEAAARVRRHGDLSREFRRLNPPFSYETFREWTARAAELRRRA
jgi:hypothetical protein